ncbi:NAD-dependent epimerase/dehydratase family protein [Cordyceps javanica]|uniref:NAD-dependent epimerase/dehydratase family protein n=1 Tax=Cordyceps javanica TaxID=43265 RepID=A0A545UY16_9HYPO|nr:NAD-dependent epimerase/dehydratase family protein [Cordyceps javanica]TQW06233.1 NAD-dependent epimerase/dehydratase family protein [Cordyceps javanica]
MSKQPPPPQDSYVDSGDMPPPYSPRPSSSTTVPSDAPVPYSSCYPPSSSSSSSIHAADSLFAAHLATMRCQIREQQATRASLQDRHDARLLALLVPHVEAVLASLAATTTTTTAPPPRLVQATLIPDCAAVAPVAAGWTPAETHGTGGRGGETHSVVRVQTRLPAKMAGDGKLPATTATATAAAAAEPGDDDAVPERQEFDGWGRWGEDAAVAAGGTRDEDELWWKDEDLAVRLASHLQPARRNVVAVDRPTVAARAAESNKARSRWKILGGGGGGGGRSSGGSTPPPPPPPPTLAVASRPAAPVQCDDDDVSMRVTAEEVTFRRENEMGIWESNTGWGVVVRVSIRT